jgi:hypothetical protein
MIAALHSWNWRQPNIEHEALRHVPIALMQPEIGQARQPAPPGQPSRRAASGPGPQGARGTRPTSASRAGWRTPADVVLHVVLHNGWTCPVAQLPINLHVKVLVTSGLHWDVHARASVSVSVCLVCPNADIWRFERLFPDIGSESSFWCGQFDRKTRPRQQPDAYLFYAPQAAGVISNGSYAPNEESPGLAVLTLAVLKGGEPSRFNDDRSKINHLILSRASVLLYSLFGIRSLSFWHHACSDSRDRAHWPGRAVKAGETFRQSAHGKKFKQSRCQTCHCKRRTTCQLVSRERSSSALATSASTGIKAITRRPRGRNGQGQT